MTPEKYNAVSREVGRWVARNHWAENWAQDITQEAAIVYHAHGSMRIAVYHGIRSVLGRYRKGAWVVAQAFGGDDIGTLPARTPSPELATEARLILGRLQGQRGRVVVARALGWTLAEIGASRGLTREAIRLTENRERKHIAGRLNRPKKRGGRPAWS